MRTRKTIIRISRIHQEEIHTREEIINKVPSVLSVKHVLKAKFSLINPFMKNSMIAVMTTTATTHQMKK